MFKGAKEAASSVGEKVTGTASHATESTKVRLSLSMLVRLIRHCLRDVNDNFPIAALFGNLLYSLSTPFNRSKFISTGKNAGVI
jgi:hypothetical protein